MVLTGASTASAGLVEGVAVGVGVALGVGDAATDRVGAGVGVADRGPRATNATAPAQTTATAAAISVARRRGSVGRIGKISP
ncbi:hypothetical protein EDF41_0875 [Curtobacterium sp. PhB171]|nr:hypothetical protein EDF41_0875 [Curtobacterium sp. PhB171]ROQ28920.1 hypothetical protein EDF40_0149 [Curtobacterium sp. PhB170]ROS45936.1 hypothetical protein EDF25_0700 [Curtobacterium sp. PhB131]ROS67762.1 hypothetical protein EDF30_2095 [Curtobacterium sp. PhB141]